jgi:hypothetical protein
MTDEQIIATADACGMMSFMRFAHAIEAKLKEKNT